MSRHPSTPVGGFALLLGSLIALYAHFVHLDEGDPGQLQSFVQHQVAAHLPLALGAVLVLLGLPLAYPGLARSGWLGLAGVAGLFGAVFSAELMHSLLITAAPAIAQAAPDKVLAIFGGLEATPFGLLQRPGDYLALAGALLLGLEALRTPGLGRASGALLLLSFGMMLGQFVPALGVLATFFIFPFYLGLGLLGLSALSGPFTALRPAFEPTLQS